MKHEFTDNSERRGADVSVEKWCVRSDLTLVVTTEAPVQIHDPYLLII